MQTAYVFNQNLMEHVVECTNLLDGAFASISFQVLEFECDLDIQEDSSNNVCSNRMENEDTN